MSEVELLKLAEEAIILVLKLSLPSIIAASLVGTLVSLFQALTQVQEQTLSFVVKLVTIIICLVVTGSWMGAELLQFSQRVFDLIAQ
ncbi:type III secretion system export apparatus subunit SctS [Pleionea sediminis]|uniref:type III secretion system export apparatus subunit SctS n=1 Tax=Pleionea sediminis TaxID=2569479 RepID=UPI0011855AD4|nr:type III secretion system export apparatus subunit SctS [Pleionea sediminis]